jgi:FSR family fosmidomycin resistance protein-like MFS transporter
MDQRSLRVQWVQLIVLSAAHFLLDMFGNVLPSILPVIRQEFAMSLSVAGVILASLILTSNGVQVLTGQMRPEKSRPLFLHIGLLMATGICLIALVPRTAAGVPLLVGLGVLTGTGIAIAHPEGLRAVLTLDRIAPTLSTAVFMTSGFLGFASGGAVSASLVTAFGLSGLLPLMLCPLLGVAAIWATRVCLAVEGGDAGASATTAPSTGRSVPFWKVLAIGVPSAVSTNVILLLTPTYLNSLGFDLTFGGFSTAMYGWGGAIGPFVWAAVARRKGDLPSSVWAFTLALPFAVLYLVFVHYKAAAFLLFGTGFSAMAGYILTITLAREARGLNLGHRMAFIVGGTWGMATLVFLPLSILADHIGTGVVLKLTPAGYLLSGVFAFSLLRQYPELSQRHVAGPAGVSPLEDKPLV